MIVTGHMPEGERFDGVPFEGPFDIAFADILSDGWETIEQVDA